jgi:hypothetical protein
VAIVELRESLISCELKELLVSGLMMRWDVRAQIERCLEALAIVADRHVRAERLRTGKC